ncbi:carboxymuconolactone decarboxylase family protein [Cloacibacillus evryensis]|uniref:Carboxymuconolactone decarboxylase family protein n=3 Tax=root TaxID=1 RepID=A0AAW5K4H1_9BACT|nr:carboxymuconolactone decarboxylase family protein [Cloacibacillus evryensis]EHL63838.1 alkylhydroperoxidase AhpD family core domain-containing protein [Synergistes sp. 3_1_syn1]MCQ4814039.1 carboxymuconolactone decarboxylase family protein [Cloacibacillus evryensis]MEA5034911.1 carboxymuconolactone decarboxylase family protein [Cloacibacillus evryensis]
MENAVKRLEELKNSWGVFAEASPDVIGAFGQMREACCGEGGALDFKTKELVSVAVAVARKCEPCILSHVELIVDLGVSRQELVEALNTAILLCGGPGWAYSAFALQAYDQMTEAKK